MDEEEYQSENYRIINDIGEEINDPDLSLGYLKLDNLLIADLPKIWHYEVDFFLFEDGYKYIPVSRDDPHVRTIDPTVPIFGYNDLEESGRKISGILTKQVVDQEAVKQYETVYRYIRYTEEELIMRGLPARITASEQNIDNLSLDFLDLVEVTAELSGSNIEERVDDLMLQLDDTNSRIDTTEDRITHTENRISTTENRISTTENQIINTKDRILNAESRITSTESQVTNIEDLTLNIQNRVNNAESNITNAENRITITENQIIDNENRITDTELTVEDLLLFIADLAGGADEESFEEEESENISPEENSEDTPLEEENL